MKKLMAIAAAATALLTSPIPATAMGDAPMDGKQSLVPPHSVEMYLDGFHNYKTDAKLAPDKQLQGRYAHYCKQIKPNLFQCLIYAGTTKDAKLIGVEYVVTNDVYQAMSAKEKQFWHPHDQEVDSGMLRMPGVDADTEKKTLNFLKTTWGKTWHAWQPGDEIPVGEARLMWSVAAKDINAKTKEQMAAREKDPTF
jgi:hypothetical protein